MVEQAFAEMGYESHRDRELSTVRGKVKVDVFAVKRNTPIPTVVLCECKHWTKPVEQSVVYGFRSICADVGAHFGLVISKAGFQSGAQATRESTNIHLLDFDGFQETFFDEWREGIFMKFAQMSGALTPIAFNQFVNKDPVLDARLLGVNPFSKYEMFFGERSFRAYFIEHGGLPVQVTDPRGDPRNSERISIATFRQYFEVASQGFTDACKHFDIKLLRQAD